MQRQMQRQVKCISCQHQQLVSNALPAIHDMTSYISCMRSGPDRRRWQSRQIAAVCVPCCSVSKWPWAMLYSLVQASCESSPAKLSWQAQLNDPGTNRGQKDVYVMCRLLCPCSWRLGTAARLCQLYMLAWPTPSLSLVSSAPNKITGNDGHPSRSSRCPSFPSMYCSVPRARQGSECCKGRSQGASCVVRARHECSPVARATVECFENVDIA